jgi:peptidoglycan-associated lipoprotein
MTRRPWHTTLTVVALFAGAVLLAGCPKKPAPVAGTGGPGSGAGPSLGATGAGSGSGSGSDSGSGSGGSMGSGPGSGTGALGSGAGGAGSGAGGAGGGAGGAGAGGSTAGGAGATGTTIPALPSPKEFVETSALRDVQFDFDKYEVRTQDRPVLDENARWLKSNGNALLLIEGHCDERGTNEYNLALGERRAKATRDYLVSAGIDGSRITVISYGEERPACTERSEGCWAQNRRAHFLVKQ